MTLSRSRLLLAAVVAIPVVCLAQLDTMWVRTYDGGQADEDWITDMVVTEMGEVYVAGCATTDTTFTDIVVQKYSPEGNLMWTSVYSGDGANEDSASALCVDREGNVYVCGWTITAAGGADMVTMRIGPSGDTMWTRTYHRGDWDAAMDICLSETDNLYVTGYLSDTIPVNIDYCTIRYDPGSGDTIWVRTYNRTPENDEDASVAMCTDTDGNVYVTGLSFDEATDYDFCTIKYDAEGSRQWIRRFDNQWLDEDYAVDIACDPTDQGVVVGGVVYDDNHDYDYFTIKYSPQGDSLWARAYNMYPANDEDLLMAVAVDENGAAYVTGSSYADVTDYDICTVRYSPTGQQSWVARYDLEQGEDAGTHLAFGPGGRVYVTGYVEGWWTDWDLAVQEIDTSGWVIWTQAYTDPDIDDEDFGFRVHATQEDFIYVGGSSILDASYVDFVLLKYVKVMHDFVVAEVVAPESLRMSDSLVPLAVVRNNSVSMDSCWLKLTAEMLDYAESSWVSLAPGDVDTVAFPAWHPAAQGEYILTCWSQLPLDQHRENDTSSAVVLVWDDTTGIGGKTDPVHRCLDLAVYPNPTRHSVLLCISLPTAAPAELGIYDIAGSCVTTRIGQGGRLSSIQPGTSRAVLDLQELPAGVYVVSLRQGDLESRQKLVVQK